MARALTIGRRRAAIVVAVTLAGGLAAASALAAVGDLTFTSCNGSLSPCTATNPANALSGADAVAISPDGNDAYVISNGQNIIDVFSRAAGGALTLAGCNGPDAGCTAVSPSNAMTGADAVAISPDGLGVYVAASFENGIVAFTRNPSTGALTSVGCYGSDNTPPGCTAPSPSYALDGAQALAVSPDGANVYVAAASGNDLATYSRNSSTGALTYVGCIGAGSCTPTNPVNAEAQLEAVAVSPDGKNVYAASYGEGVVDEYSRNQAGGALTFTGCIGNYSPQPGCTLITPMNVANALQQADALAVSADGSTVYAGGLADITVLSRNPASGLLSFAGCVESHIVSGCATTDATGVIEGVKSVAVSGDGSSVYTADNSGATLAVLARDGASGALTYSRCLGGQVDSACTATTPATAFSGIAGVAVSPDGSDVYAAAGSSLSVFSRAVPPLTCANVTATIPYNASNPSVQLNCTNPESLPLSYTSTSSGAHVSVRTISSTGLASLNVIPDYSGTESFSYHVSDSEGTSNTATATVTVAAPPPPTVTSAKFGNQKITLSTPAVGGCNASGAGLLFSISSAKIRKAKGPKLRFVEVKLYIDGGLKTTKKRKHKKVTHIAPNRIVKQNPRSDRADITGLAAGTHHLKAVFVYKRGRTTATKTLRTTFTVC